MVSTIFTSNIVYGGVLSTSVTAGTILGQLIGTATAVVGGHMKLKLVVACVLMTAFNGGVGGAEQSKAIATTLSCLGAIMVGILEGYACGLVTIVIDDQKELGAAGGIFGSVRTLGSVVSSKLPCHLSSGHLQFLCSFRPPKLGIALTFRTAAIFTSIENNKVSQHFANDVVPALIRAGLTASSAESFVGAYTAGDVAALQKIPGITDAIIATGTAAIKQAYSKAFSMVFLASIAFGGCAIIAALFVPNVDDRMTHDVVRRLEASGLGRLGGKKSSNAAANDAGSKA